VRRAAAGLVLLAGIGLGAGALAQADSGDLAQLREAIEESRSRLAYYEREERGILDALEAIEQSAALLETEVARARARAEETRVALVRAEAEASGVAERLAALETSMSRRAVALYRAGELGALPLLFAAGDLRDFLSRVQTLRRLLSHDASLLASYRETKRALDAARERAAEAAQASERAERTLADRSSQLQEERELKRRLARRLRSSRTRERRGLAELETASRALEEAVAALPAEGLSPAEGSVGTPFASLRGALPPPVAGTVSRGFGRVVDSEFQTATFRKGVEFEVETGTPVQAVADGRVRFAGRFRGYGNTVILDHGEQYFTVSAHLSEIDVAVGDWVEAGREVGRSGESGSLTGPQLYFEVRRGGEALDPRAWLE
jgi:septal ring factor EnvC (AmiA/AmiB activator)